MLISKFCILKSLPSIDFKKSVKFFGIVNIWPSYILVVSDIISKLISATYTFSMVAVPPGSGGLPQALSNTALTPDAATVVKNLRREN